MSIEWDLPDGYEVDSGTQPRSPMKGEYFLLPDGQDYKASEDYKNCVYIIITKKKSVEEKS